MPDTSLKFRSVCLCLLAGVMAGTGFGLSMPVLAFSLEGLGASGTIIGLNATVGALSTLFSAPLIPKLLRIAPPRRVLMAALLFSAACFPLFQALPNIPIWFVLRFVMGAGLTVLFVTSETWLNQMATRQDRGILIAAYATALGIGFAAGGALPSLVGVSGWTPFLTGSLLFVLASLPLMMRATDPEPPTAHATSLAAIASTIRMAPVLTCAALTFGTIEMSIFTFLPLFGDGIGLGPDGGALLLSAAALGGVGIPLVMGWLAGRMGLRPLLLACTVLCVACFIGVTAPLPVPALYVLMFFGGGFALSIYTLGLTEMGSRFTGSAVVTANAVFVTMYGTGSLIGPTVTGWARDGIGITAIPVAIAAYAALYGAMIVIRWITNPIDDTQST